ncbi:MAG: hypothetical protein NTZ16_10680 [Verrucomicrobia bacterium]|nr:hypothetical protein [Verrucomicrobiota bacterium]
MNTSPRFTAAVLLLAATTWLRAAETNQFPTLPSVAWKTPPTNKPAKQERSKIRPDRPSNEERRARIEAWRAEHGGTNHLTIKETPLEDTSHIPLPERRARLRAKLDELRQKTNSVPPATAPTNSPAAHPVAPK